MLQQIKDILARHRFQELSIKEVLDSFSEIELTEEEHLEAILWRKNIKAEEIKQRNQKERERQNRKLLIESRFTVEQTMAYMADRNKKVFEGRFIVDDVIKPYYDLLCYYFSEDSGFESLAAAMGVKNPSLKKGLFIPGNFGVGKTWLMKMFQKNRRQVFKLVNAKEIANAYEQYGEPAIEEFLRKTKNAFEDPTVFFQDYCGLCIDDLGTENTKQNYGNKRNVIGDILEMRYASGDTGIYLHATTNLSAAQLESFYGPRITSRMSENFNWIPLNGKDRRR